MTRPQKQNRNEKLHLAKVAENLGNEPPSQRGKEEEAAGPPKKKFCKKKETPTDKKLTGTKDRMGPTAPNNKCQHNDLCK